MKRALVVTLLVFGLGIGVAAQSFSGSWVTDITFTVNPLNIGSLTSILDVEYALSGWTFGANMFVDEIDLFDINFDIAGSLGAFSFWSFLDFDPGSTTQTPSFTNWSSLVKVSIAGVELWGAFVLQDKDDDGSIATGWTVGGHGLAGDVEIWASVDFNVDVWSTYTVLTVIDGWGWDTLYDWGTYWDCGDAAWLSGTFTATDETCDPAFTNLDIYIEAPLTCLDFGIWVNFTCDVGFNYINFMLNDIDLGAGWFQLDDLDVKFTVLDKTVTTDFTLTFGDAVCVTPYFDLNQVGLNVIDGITLRALTLSYTYNGVTIKAGEVFDTYYAGFTKSGSLTRYAKCAVTSADEFIGVFFDGDSCCGGLTSASLVTFFDSNLLTASTSTGIFDFVLITANVEVGIGSGFSIRGGIDVADDGLAALMAGFTFSF